MSMIDSGRFLTYDDWDLSEGLFLQVFRRFVFLVGHANCDELERHLLLVQDSSSALGAAGVWASV